MTTMLRLTDEMLTRIHADLDRPHAYAGERVGFLTCGVAGLARGGLCLYAAQYHPVADDDYEDDVPAAAMLGAGAFRKILQQIYRHPASVLHVHRHDHHGRPGPSMTDQVESRRFVPNFWNVCPQHPHGTVILSFDDMWGALWIERSRPVARLNRYAIVGDRTQPFGAQQHD